MSKEFNIIGIIVGVAGVAYAMYTTRKMDKLCTKIGMTIDKAIDDVSKDIHIDIEDEILKTAVDRAVDRKVSDRLSVWVNNTIRGIENDMHQQIKRAVNEQYADIRTSVSEQVTKEVSRIDINALKKDVTEKAKHSIVEKFDGNLDNLLDEFNSNLANVSKIYKSIADTMGGSKEKETVLRIS